jgi:hypothetical protein
VENNPTPLMKPDATSSLQIAAAADILANIHDLPIPDPQSEFQAIMQESFPSIDRELLGYIYSQFMSVGPETRFSADFNHTQFVKNAYSRFRK